MKVINVSELMKLAKNTAEQSPDPSRKVGAVIQTSDFSLIADYNHETQGVNLTPKRLERPAKYTFIEHAERNAIYKAASHGISLKGASMVLPWFPCADCARGIVQSGVSDLYVVEPDWTETRYGFKDAKAILEEGGVAVTYVGE